MGIELKPQKADVMGTKVPVPCGIHSGEKPSLSGIKGRMVWDAETEALYAE
jgi:hypothetical protein